MNCSMGIDASASIAGYIEFSYASGEIVYSEGGMILEASLGASVDYKLPPCPAVYVTFGLNAGFDGKIRLVRESTLKYTPSIDAGIDLEAKLGVGAGSKKVKTYAELGMKGKLELDLTLPASRLADALAAKLTAYVYFDSKVFGFKGPNYGPEEFASYQIYPRNGRARALFNGADLMEFDWDSAELSERSYLTSGKVNSVSLYGLLGEESFTKSNLYPYSAPQMAALDDGSKLLIWIDDNGEKSGINKTSLMYSIYNGTTWSPEAVLAETGGANDYPTLFSNGQTVRIVWQKAAELTDQDTLPTLLKSVELYMVTYENGNFEEAQRITSDNELYEMMQSIDGSGNDYTITWIENEQNNPFQSEGKNTIKMKTCKNGEWQQEQIVVDEVEEVYGLRIVYVGDSPVIVYETSGEETSIIHIIKGTETITFPGCGFDLENGILYYNSGSELIAYDIATGVQEAVLSANLSDCTVLDDGLHKVILTTVYHGYTSELIAYQFNEMTGVWSNGITLTSRGKYIRDYSAVMEADGKISAVLNFVDINENSETIYGNAQLCVMDFTETEDLTIGDGVYYDEKLVAPNAILPLYFDVTNNGWDTIEKFHIDILNESEKVLQSEEISCEIDPGDSVETSFNYRLPSTILYQKLKIKIHTTNETNLTDNTAQVEIGTADIALDNLYLEGSQTSTVLKGTIQNLGYRDAEEVEVIVYSWNIEGDVIGKTEIATIQKQKSDTFEITIPQKYLEVNPLSSGNVLYVTAASNIDELDYANNSVQYLIKSTSDEPVVLNYRSLIIKQKEEKQLQVVYSSVADLSQSTIQWESSDDSIVLIEDGKITAVSSGNAVVTAIVSGYRAICNVQVSDDISVESVYLDEMSVNILLANTKQLTAHILPDNATNQNIMWESDTPSVATVNANGVVKGVKVGSAIITAYTEDGYKSVSCRVTVSQQTNQSYTVDFAGGEGVRGTKPDIIICKAGEIFALPENTFQKDGMFFAGWSDGTSSYKPGEYYKMPYHNILFTALWSENGQIEYTITASAHTGGTIIPDGISTVLEGEKIQYIIIPDEGHMVSDVKVDGESVGPVMEYTFENITANHIIEALFKSLNGFTVIFDSQGGSLVDSITGIKPGETVILPIPTKEKHKFMGWYTEPDGNGIKYTEESIIENDITLYAYWITDSEEVLLPPSSNIVSGSKVKKGTKVTLECSINECAIYYTLDGTQPTRQSILYTEPIIINSNITIMAFAVKEGYIDSDIVTLTFIVAADGEDLNEVEGVLPEDIPEDGKIPEGLWIAAIADVTYTGSAIKPDAHVYDNTVRLKVGKDYTISYKNNTKAALSTAAKAPMIIIKGKGNYSGSETQVFTIAKKNIHDVDVVKTFTDAYAISASGKNPSLVFQAKYKNKKLNKNRDYILTVKDSTGKMVNSYATEGIYCLTVKGTGANYFGEYDLTFEVLDKIPVSKLKIDKIPSMEYDGTQKQPELIVKYGKTSLRKDVDYSLNYQNNIEVGTASVMITGMGEYFGTRNITFTIAGRQMKKVKLSGFQSTIGYTGTDIEQKDVLLSFDGERLTKDKDYTVTYNNNLNVGSATVIYTGRGKYAGTLKKNYKIHAYNMAKDLEKRLHLSDEPITASYVKGGAKPSLKLYDGTKLLIEDKDYKLSYQNNTTVTSNSTPKKPTIIIKGKGNYTGIFEQRKEFTITEKDLSEIFVTIPDIVVSTKIGKYKSIPILSDTNGVKLKAGIDYDKNYNYIYKNSTKVTNDGVEVTRNAGEAVNEKDIIPVNTILCVIINAKAGSNYIGVTKQMEYRIVAASISKAKITVRNPDMGNKNLFSYTGKEVTINKDNLTVKVGNTMLANNQYEILEDTYKNNIQKGTASVQLKGIGENYGGTATVKFKIGTKRFQWFFRLFG